MSITLLCKTPNGQFKIKDLTSKTTFGELSLLISKEGKLEDFEVLMGFPPKLVIAKKDDSLESLSIKNGEALTVRSKGNTGIKKGEGGFKSLSDLFGDYLIDAKGNKVNVSEISKNKRIGLYFSAHWCPPCKMFTPYLSKVYQQLKQDGQLAEIIFISADREEGEFKEYFKTMPWLAIPFSSNLRNKLSEQYEIEGIPSLVILNGSGQTVTKEGREIVSKDPSGKLFMN